MPLELAVWLFADAVGTLTLAEGRLAFQYDADWLQRPDAVALSAALPLQAEAFDDARTRPFFAGLLPEGRLRQLIAQQLQVSGRNDFALLDRGRSTVLAPLYDILSTAVYPDLTPKMAMKIGSKYRFDEVQARHWDQFAEAAGLARAPCRKRIGELARALPGAARQLQARAGRGFADRPVIEQIVTLIEQRAALTLRRLQDKTD